MGNNTKEPTYTGMDKYPGIISTVITIVITVIFIGALYIKAGGVNNDANGKEAKSEEQQ